MTTGKKVELLDFHEANWAVGSLMNRIPIRFSHRAEYYYHRYLNSTQRRTFDPATAIDALSELVLLSSVDARTDKRSEQFRVASYERWKRDHDLE